MIYVYHYYKSTNCFIITKEIIRLFLYYFHKHKKNAFGPIIIALFFRIYLCDIFATWQAIKKSNSNFTFSISKPKA